MNLLKCSYPEIPNDDWIKRVNDKSDLRHIYDKLKEQEYFYFREDEEISCILIRKNDMIIDVENLGIYYPIEIRKGYYILEFLDYYSYKKNWALNERDLLKENKS